MGIAKSLTAFIAGIAVLWGIAWIMFELSPLRSIVSPLALSDRIMIVFPFVLAIVLVIWPGFTFWLDTVDTLAGAPDD